MEKNEPKNVKANTSSKAKAKAPRKEKTMAGPDGVQIPIHMLNPQIVKGDQLVRNVIDMAGKLHEITEHYYHQINAMVSAHLTETAETYGEKWQGNCNLTSFDGSQRVEVDSQNIIIYDELLQVATEKIRTWLDSKLGKTTDPEARKTIDQFAQIVKTALRIDNKGQIDQKKLVQLQKYEFADEPEWKEAMDLINQSRRVVGTKRYLRFKMADPKTGKLEPIVVDFSRM